MGLKNVLGGGALKLLGNKMDGHKTRAAGIYSLLIGLAGYLGIAFKHFAGADLPPELLDLVNTIPQMDFITATAFFLGGLGALGIGGKAEKVKKAIEENTRAVEKTAPPAVIVNNTKGLP